MAQPNDWGKQVKASTASGESSERRRQYWDFWEQFLTKIQTDHPTWSRARSSTTSSSYDVSLGSGAVLESTFTRRGLSAWIYFGAPNDSVNLGRFQILQQTRERFESALGRPAVWDQMDGRKATRIGAEV